MSIRVLNTKETTKKMRWTSFPYNKTHHSDKSDEKNVKIIWQRVTVSTILGD